MPACSLERELNGNTAFYRVSGKFDGAGAWELSGRLQNEPFSQVVVDFSQATDFLDCSVGVIAATLLTSRKRIQFRGIRQHQERLFGYFGVDPSAFARATAPMSGLPPSAAGAAAKEVA